MNRGSHSRGVDRARRLSGTGTPVFRIEGDRVSIVTDPYTPEVAGLDPVEWPVNLVIMSSATDTFHSKAANDGAKDLPRATGYRGKALHHGSSRGIEGPRSLDQLRRPTTKICALAPSKLGSFSTRLMASRSLDRRAESSSQWSRSDKTQAGPSIPTSASTSKP